MKAATENVPSSPEIIIENVDEKNIPKAGGNRAQPAADDMEEENVSQVETDEIYDSDLDPDNYDSDLEYEIYRDVQKLADQVRTEKSRQRDRDGPGHVFVYSDSPSDDRKHRIKVGATRSPDKKFRQAQSFNPSFKMVTCTAVSQRKAALDDVLTVLHKYKLDSYDDWFVGPIDKILQFVSTVTEKYGSGPALSSFQTDSLC